MSPSILDFMMQRGRMPSGMELLRERQRQRGLVDGQTAQAAAPRPTIFNPNAGQAASLRQMQGTAELARDAPDVPQEELQGVVQDTRAAAVNARRGGLAREIMTRTGRELTTGQRRWIEETADAEVNGAGPGRSEQGFFSRLIAGNLPPAMTARERKDVLRGAMTQAGLAMLMGRGHDQATVGEAVSFGRMYGQGVAQAWYSAAENAGDELNRRQAMQDAQQLYTGFKTEDRSELETWQLVRQEARDRGMENVLDLATKELELLSDLPAGEAERRLEVIDGVPYSFDESGQAYDMDGEPVGTAAFSTEAARERPIKRTRQRPDGTTVEFLADPYTGEPVQGSEVVTGRPDPEAEGADEVDPERASVGAAIRREVDQISDLIGDDPATEEIEVDAGRFGLTGSFGRLARILPNELEPSDLKQLRAASQNVLSLIIRDRSGAQAADAEVQRLESFAVVKPGDDEATIRSKLERLRDIVATFEQTGDANAAVDPVMGVGGDAVDDDEYESALRALEGGS